MNRFLFLTNVLFSLFFYFTDSLYSELDHVCSLTRTSSVRHRRHYAHLDIGSMGVDVTTGPVTNLDRADHQNNR